MRVSFVSTLTELSEEDSRIILLTGDMGYTVIESFAEKFPERYFNVGVAEQNMVGVATGLAEAGFLPFVYSIATFVSLRPYEFIRNGPVLQRLPVRLIGIGGGFEYGSGGSTHHALEDIGIMRIQPGLTVIAPADANQTRSALLATWDLPGPIYYRLGKCDKTIVPGINGQFELGHATTIRQGSDLLIISMGSVTSEAVEAANVLATQGLDCEVVVVASLNPAPADDLADSLSRFSHVLTVESHYVSGGVGSLVSEIVAERGLNCRVRRCGVKSTPDGKSGSMQHLRHQHGLSSEALVQTAHQILLEIPR